MTENDNYNRKSVAGAALAAGLVIIAFSVAYSVMAARLAAPMNIALLAPEALERLPLQIGGWTGKEAPLDEAIVSATDTDAHVSRIYSRHSASEYISLYIAYGVRARDLMPHRPEVCYTGTGWTLIDRSSMDLPLSDEMELSCNVFKFSRGTLNKKKTLVLNYYIVDGQYCRDVSLLRSKAWRGSGTVRYVAQIQIVASITMNLAADSAMGLVCDFAAESASSISRLFESAEENRYSDKGRFDTNNMFRGTVSG